MAATIIGHSWQRNASHLVYIPRMWLTQQTWQPRMPAAYGRAHGTIEHSKRQLFFCRLCLKSLPCWKTCQRQSTDQQ